MNTTIRSIVVYTPTVKLSYRDLMNARVLEMLNKYYFVNWFVRDFNDKKDFLNSSRTYRLTSSPFRTHIWSLLFELENYVYNNKKLGGRQSFPFLGMSRKQIVLLKLITKWNMVHFVTFCLKSILRITVPKIPDSLRNSSLVICFSSSKDFFFDDIVRMSRRCNKKVIMVALNWDNATSKPYIEKPNLVLTWGKQTAELSSKIHGIDSRPIGTPRFESYKSMDIFGKSESIKRLGLKSEFKYILFAGVGFPFPEIEVLNKLAEYLEKENKSDFRVIYRPHPYSWKSQQHQKSDFFHKYILFDPTLSLFDENDPNLYRYLFAACDAFISAYSTMLVEAALHGLPILLVAFNDESDEYFDWVNHANMAPHLQILQKNKWIIHCHDLYLLPKALEFFFETINKNTFEKEARQMAKEIVYLPKVSYAECLNNYINSLITN